MGKIGKRQLIDTVSDRADLPKSTVQKVLALAFAAITDELAKGNAVTIKGFGTWRTKVCTPRAGRHPQTGAPLSIPARTRVLFKPGVKLRSGVEYAVDPEIFLGAGIAEKTELEGALARLFGARPEIFHLEGEQARVRAVLEPGPQEEAEEFFATLCKDMSLGDLLSGLVEDEEDQDADQDPTVAADPPSAATPPSAPKDPPS